MANLEWSAPGMGNAVRVGMVHAGAAPGANTDILGTTTTRNATARLTPSAMASAYRVQVSLATGSVFDLHVTDGTTAYTQHLNAGAALTASCIYTFVVLVAASKDGTTALTYNFRVATDGVIQTLIVDEVIGGVL